MVLAIPNSKALDAAGKSRSKQNSRRTGALAAAGVGIALGSGISYYSKTTARRKELKLLGDNARPKMHHLAVDAICGAVGEVAGLVALYPLDTIKVKCQAANGVGVGQVLRETFALGPANAVKTLYAGMGSTALGAAAIGSLYLLTFYAAKRAGTSIESKFSKKADHPSSSNETTSASPLVASAAGAAASIVGSFIDAPIEAFKVRAQAGAGGSGSMLGSMASLVLTQGFAPLYCSFLPFLLKSIPHDVAELFTYSQINELATTSSSSDHSSTKTEGHHFEKNSVAVDGVSRSVETRRLALTSTAGAFLSSLPIEARDMLIGAASGAAAAIASMPFDVTFTRMNLGTCVLPGAAGTATAGTVGLGSMRHSFSSFASTVRLIVAQGGGPHALYAGVVPRLLQTVPAGMVYWAAVEATRRALESKYDIGTPSSSSSQQVEGILSTSSVVVEESTSTSLAFGYSSTLSSDDEATITPIRKPSSLSTTVAAATTPSHQTMPAIALA